MIQLFILFLILIFNINYILCQETDNITDIWESFQLKGIYRIDSIQKGGYSMLIDNNQIKFTNKKEGKERHFRIIPTDSNSYIIETKVFNKRIGINVDDDKIKLIDKSISENLEEIYWNIIQINANEFLIQNNLTKNYLEFIEKSSINYYPQCSNNLSDIIVNDTIIVENITSSFKFSFLKLYEEVELKPEHIKYIEKEPVDILIKYIDLSDKKLNRTGIIQNKFKDNDNEELKYCVRSIIQNIPWFRKIFILMPNEKVRYFKPIEEISDKIVYVKDIDLIGFDSANSYVFQFHLGNMSEFGISENFILMDDDYFFGKPINKTKFFYYDEKQNKVLPSVVTDDFNEFNQKEINHEYNKLARRRYSIKVHSFFGWKLAQLTAFKLLLDNFKSPLINAGFTHNAIPLNTNDLKEIYEFIVNKYEFAKDALFSKTRNHRDLQSQSLFNSYMLNIKKRKVNSIPWVYYDLGAIKNKSLNIEMFVINTSGDRIYKKNEIEFAKQILEQKFNTPTPYEIVIDSTINNNYNNSGDISNNFTDITSTNFTNKIKDNNSGDISNNVTEIISNNSTDNTKDNNSDDISNNVTEIISNNSTDNTKDNNSDDISNNETKIISNNSTNDLSDNNLNNSSNYNSKYNNNSNDISEKITEYIHVSDNISDNISNYNISKNFSDNKTEDNINNTLDNNLDKSINIIFDNTSSNKSSEISNSIDNNDNSNNANNSLLNITSDNITEITEKIQDNKQKESIINIRSTILNNINNNNNISNDLNNATDNNITESQYNESNKDNKEMMLKNNKTEDEKYLNEDYEKKYFELLFYFKIVLIILASIIFIFLIRIICCLCSKGDNYNQISEYHDNSINIRDEENSYFR